MSLFEHPEHPQARLLVFAKAPVANQVKTRLIPFINPEQAAKLHQQLITRTLSMTVSSKLCPVQLWCSPSSKHPWFQHCKQTFSVQLYEQQGQNLGERMAHAFTITLQRYDYALLIGSDCPSLASEDIKQAGALLQQGYDAVIAPAEDGGYTLLGLKTPYPELFTQIDWSTSKVLSQTLSRLQQLKLNYYQLREQWDIDRPIDLQRWQTILTRKMVVPKPDLRL